MKKSILILLIGIFYSYSSISAQASQGISVYLITCGPGTATYSVYGHSALRIAITERNTDLVYNWGVFDFATPNFAWKFAKGRLDYKLGVISFDRFQQEYFLEQRWIKSQKINLEPEEINILFGLISENLKPENLNYRYDFFYDDCSTRIRDLLEKSIGNKLTYPPEPKKDIPTFRDMVGKYQRPFPWLKLGVDLIMGTPGEKKASFRDKMFLPLDMQEGLSAALINRNSRLVPLLQNPEKVLDFETPVVRQQFLLSPIFLFSVLFILSVIFFARNRNRKAVKVADIAIFSIFSLLALLMIFFNFFTDHQQMKWNLNIIWLSPVILFCLAAIILEKEWFSLFRIVLFLCILSFIIQIIMPDAFNQAFIPLLLILMLRSSARAGFSWNPLSVASF
jgi:hypothetical protein